ncbi:MAG: hypothetical protein WCF95_00285, partial [bacterium]
NKEEQTFGSNKGFPAAMYESSNVASITINAFQDNYLTFKHLTKIAYRNKSSGVVSYYYFFKLPDNWDEEEQESLLKNLQFNAYGIGILHQKYDYEVVNDIPLKKTAIIEGELWESLKRFDRQVAEHNKNNYNTEFDIFEMNELPDVSSCSYHISYHLLHNLIPEKIVPNDTKYMGAKEQTIIKNNGINIKGFNLNLSEKRLIEALLIMISNSSYIHDKAKLSEARFKISRKNLSKLICNSNFRIDKALETARALSSRLFLYKNKVEGSSYLFPVLGRLFELKENDDDLTFIFSKYFLKGLRPIKEEGYFVKRDVGFYEKLSLGRGFGKDVNIYTFLEYLFLIKSQNFSGKQTPCIKSNLSNLLKKIDLKNQITSKGINYVFDKFNNYLEIAHKAGFIELFQFNTLHDFRAQLKKTESLGILLL